MGILKRSAEKDVIDYSADVCVFQLLLILMEISKYHTKGLC